MEGLSVVPIASDTLETALSVHADVVGRAGVVADVTLVDVDVTVSSGVASVGAVALVARDQVLAVSVNARTRLALVDVITAGVSLEAVETIAVEGAVRVTTCALLWHAVMSKRRTFVDVFSAGASCERS